MEEVIDYLIFRDWIVPLIVTLIVLFIWLLMWFANKLEEWFKNKKK